MTAIEAVIFDWGGTLTPWHTIDFDDVWRSYAGVYAPERADELTRDLMAAEREAWCQARDHQRSGTLDDLFTSVGVTPSGARHEQALAAYQKFWEPHTYLDPDARTLLTELRDRGVRLGVLSNTLWSKDFHDEVFRRDQVLELFDGAIYSSEIPWTKPHPEAFAAALKAVGNADPAAAVFVGDRLYDDIYGAQQVGMRAIHVPNSDIPDEQRGHSEGVPDATVRRLTDIIAVLDRWRV
ncbi:MAG TPA: HAD-IA family hydrolase [Mycobacteriales bacterium]|nr:HAD-IA family hydrolase [Mycobacteriales bacterium]